MEYTLTTDHDEIRSWMEEHGGKPAIRNKHENRRGVLDVCFDDLNPDFQIISWEEFFDTFDALHMTFRYECLDEICNQFSYSFIHADEMAVDADGEMPDEVPIENVIASAPANSGPDSINNDMTYM